MGLAMFTLIVLPKSSDSFYEGKVCPLSVMELNNIFPQSINTVSGGLEHMDMSFRTEYFWWRASIAAFQHYTKWETSLTMLSMAAAASCNSV